MKCPYCGGETKEQICEYCGSQLHAKCFKCGSNNVFFKRENQGKVYDDNPRQVVYRTVGLCKDCGNTWVVITDDKSKPNSKPERNKTNTPPKKRKNGLWVIVALFAIFYLFFNPIKAIQKQRLHLHNRQQRLLLHNRQI